jgi:hypothetical protein
MSDKTEPGSADGRKVFDVSPPGKTPAPQTSKPVIVGNRPMLQDPMMVDSEKPSPDPLGEESTESKLSETSPWSSQITIDRPAENQHPKEEVKVVPEETKVEVDPVPETTRKDEESKPDATEKVDDPVDDKNAETDDKKPIEESEQPTTTKTDIVEGGSQDDTIPSEEDKKHEPTTAELEAAKKEVERQTELEKLIESKQYALPINSVQHKKTSRTFLYVLLVLVVLVVAADLVLDSGVWKTSVNIPHTHFFNKN